ncbi:hypothetical protein ACIQZI_13210 [Peribacillus sp. NPDC096379]|uniref:hypothetical protein n=1 Tax=Peribacillus sp. NPDC096379 TaxID=3364393 RepID=UPI00380AB2B7
MLRKYLYAGILLGAIVLVGCVNEEMEIEKTSESLTDGQTVEIESLSDTNKAEEVVVVAPTLLDLTQEQKEDYYKEYVTTIEKVNSEYGANLEIEPIDEFLDEYWVEVEEFEKMVEDRAKAKIIVSKNTDTYAPDLVPKIARLHTGSNVRTISFSGSFETQLNSNTPEGRQLFSGMNSISSQVEGDDGIWIQTGYDYLTLDSGRSYSVIVGGKYSEKGVSSPCFVEIEFHCNKYGGIS